MKEIMGGKGRRERPTNTEVGEQTRRRTPGQKHELGDQKRNKRRENPKHKTYPKIPTQSQLGRSSNQLPPKAHNLYTEAGVANGQSPKAGGTAQHWDPQGLPVAPNPLPSPQHFLLRIQDNGQGRAGSSCIHPRQGSSVEEARIPVSLWGGEGNTGVCPPEKGEERREGKQAGPSPCLRLMLWRPLPWGRCQAGAQECG